MNKKLFFGLFAATGMLFATSCSDDELQSIQSGNEAQVSFTLGLEGGIASRAISDGMSVDKLVYAVYDADNKLITTIAGSDNGGFVKDNAFQNGLTENVNITLAKGQTYTVVFWAQDETCNAYTVTTETDGIKVAVDYNGQNNDETRDAFFKAETFKVSGNAQINVTLKRPFAQVNVGVTKADWDAAVASGIDVEESKVVIKNAATGINLLDGTVTGEAAVEYAFATIPAKFATEEVLTVDVDGDGTISEDENYKYLSMSYILTAAEKSTLESDGLQFTFSPANGEDIVFDEGLHSVPVQRNWRTNILGKLLTGDIEFNIVIDPVFDNDYNYPEYIIIAELEQAASAGGAVTLDESIKMPEEKPFLEVSADFTLNINENVDFTTGSATNYGIIATNGATTTINGEGDIKSQGGGIGITNGASVIFNGGNLDINTTSTSGRYLFYLEGEGSTATINGGNFDFNKTQNQKRAYIYANEGTTVYVKGGNFGKASTRSGYKEGILGSGTVIITGGTFGFNPSTWVATGYKATENGGIWTVTAE